MTQPALEDTRLFPRAGETISIYLIESQALLRAGLRLVLQESRRIVILGDSSDPSFALHELEELRPKVVVVDGSSQRFSGLQLVGLIKHVSPASRILLVSHGLFEGFAQRAFEDGADGCIRKDAPPYQFLLAIDSICAGHPFLMQDSVLRF